MSPFVNNHRHVPVCIDSNIQEDIVIYSFFIHLAFYLFFLAVPNEVSVSIANNEENFEKKLVMNWLFGCSRTVVSNHILSVAIFATFVTIVVTNAILSPLLSKF
jgi:hypothetical protein